MKKIALVDGSGFIFRAFHALPPLHTKQGVPVNAVYGFTKALIALKARTDLDYLLIVFDSSRKTFRNSIYADYKAHRPPAPDDLIPQFSLIKKVPNALNISCLEIANFEADDIIATYSKLASNQGMQVEIVSSDKDLMQLVDDSKNIYMFDPLKKIIINQAKVLEKFGVLPNLVVDIQALMGDSSDNVPGVKGVGPKTATQLVNQFGNLQNIYNNINNVAKASLQKKLLENQQLAFISKQLVTLKQDIDLQNEVEINDNININNTDINNFAVKPYNYNVLYQFLYNLSFNSLALNIAKQNNHKIEDYVSNSAESITNDFVTNNNANNNLENNAGNTTPIVPTNINIIEIQNTSQLKSEIENLINNRINSREIALAIQHNSTNNHYMVNIGNNVNQLNITCGSNASLLSTNSITLADVATALQPLFNNNSINKIFYNLQSWFYTFATNCGYNIAYSLFANLHNFNDLQLMHYLLFGVTNQANNQLALQDMLNAYGLHNQNLYCVGLNALCNIYKRLLIEQNLYYIYTNIDQPLATVLNIMHYNGIKLSPTVLSNLSNQFSQAIAQLQENIFAIVQYNFNIASAKQVGEALFEKLEIKGKKNKTGSWKTDSATLEELLLNDNLTTNQHNVINYLSQWRKLFKLKTTYTDSLPNEINAVTNRVHSVFLACATSTARLSSSSPNLQNIPIKTPQGKQIRGAFVADTQNNVAGQIISLDYSQIELRILADIANVSNLITAFNNNLDIHKQTASEIFNTTLNNVTPDLRRKAKAINFGIIYGQTAFGLASSLGISKSNAKEYIESYFAKYPQIQQYMQTAIQQAKQNGYVTTILGRKCFINNINSSNGMLKAMAERAAINAKIQGSASDIVRLAMVNVNNYLQQNNVNAKLLLQIHDELLIESFATNHTQLANNLQQIMQNSLNNLYNLKVPLIVDYNIGSSWLF